MRFKNLYFLFETIYDKLSLYYLNERTLLLGYLVFVVDFLQER